MLWSVMTPMSARREFVEDAVRAYGATVDFIDTRAKPPAARVAELLVEFPDAMVRIPRVSM